MVIDDSYKEFSPLLDMDCINKQIQEDHHRHYLDPRISLE
jgi:hypothetical protein